VRFLLPSPAALICLLLLGVPARAGDADDRVLALLDEDFEEMMRTHPTWASERGDRRFDDLLDDESPEAARDRVEHAKLRLRTDEDRLHSVARADRDQGIDIPRITRGRNHVGVIHRRKPLAQ